MARAARKKTRPFGAKTQTVDLSRHFNWPRRLPAGEWWQRLAQTVRGQYPAGKQRPWGIPFAMAEGPGPRVVLVARGKREVTVPLNGRADYLCFLHRWEQIPSTIRSEDPKEGLVVGEYELTYADGSKHLQPVRARFEVGMMESGGSPWLAVPFNLPKTVDPARPPAGMAWGVAQYGLHMGHSPPQPPVLLYAMPNPSPGKKIKSLTIRGLQESPLLVAGVTLYQGASHPLRHLPRRSYRVKTPGNPRRIEKAEVDLGGVARVERTTGPRSKAWLKAPQAALNSPWGAAAREPDRGAEDLIQVFGAEDATLSVTLEGREKPLAFSLGEAFHTGKSASGPAVLESLGRQRQWMQVTVIDASTAQPTPVRIHFSGPRGEYLAPYGHHSQINANWFEDYGADVIVGGRSYAYVSGEFTTDLPVGNVYVEMWKGFEYEPVRRKVTIRPGQKALTLRINRWKDLRREGWVTADTHVHFISPQTAWLEGQGEGVNVVNLLASQWGRLFTNVGDLRGRVGLVENDTIVYVGTENRNHMLGHMSMLGTKGLPVFPMCGGGPSESWVGDPDFLAMAEWALENKRKGGVVIRPHFPGPNCEDPVPIIKGLVDAVEIAGPRGSNFSTQEWYRYLNCGYRVAVCGGTDKMSAGAPIGWTRTYARLDPNRPLSYDNWARSVRAGRTFSTTGPLIDLSVEGRAVGEVIELPGTGASLELRAIAESFLPLGRLEVVHNGRVVASAEAARGARKLELREKIRVRGSGWIAARCSGYARHPGSYAAAHTSPVYLRCGNQRIFDGPAAQHMLALVEGTMEYMQTLATAFDEASRKRMVKLFNEVRRELRGRLLVEAKHRLHSGAGAYHLHAPGEDTHRH
jgi:hypothetical protein